MSAPKFGEYMDVHAHRRERIIHDQKYPSDYVVARYTDALNAIRAAILSGGDVEKRLGDKSRALGDRAATTKYREDSQRCCVDAIAAFSKTWSSLPLADAAPAMPGAADFSVRVEGVQLTLHPALILRRTRRDGVSETGALQLVFRKEAALEAHGGQAVAELLHQALRNTGHINVAPGLCLIVDVFSGRHFAVPRHSARLNAEIKSACREIAARWPAVSARKSG